MGRCGLVGRVGPEGGAGPLGGAGVPGSAWSTPFAVPTTRQPEFGRAPGFHPSSLKPSALTSFWGPPNLHPETALDNWKPEKGPVPNLASIFKRC